MHETNCRSFINADMIAQGLSPLKPEAVQVKAGKLFLEELERHLKQRESFCFETTLSGSSYFQKIKQWKKDGWRIVLHYLWIPNAQFSALRVQEKVAQGGGHGIPQESILRRYNKSLCNLFRYLAICNETMCYDNSDLNHPLIFTMAAGKVEVVNKKLYKSIQQAVRP